MLTELQAAAPHAEFAVVPSALVVASLAVVRHKMRDAGSDAADAVASSPTMRTLAAGGAAGAASRTLTAPVDRLKVLVQEGRVLPGAAARSDLHRALSIARHVYRTEGVLAFWRGNGVNCLKAGPEQALAFTAREFFVRHVCRDAASATMRENFMVGALAGATAQLALYPMEVVKTRIAVAARGEYRGIADCVAQSLRRGGIRDLYRGCAANTAGIIPHRGIDMGLFFTLEAAVKRCGLVACAADGSTAAAAGGHHLPIYATLGCGVVASMVSQTATYPLNLARTRLQTQGVNGRAVRYRGLLHCLATVLREEGPRGLFAGIFPNMAKAVPATAISYAVFRKCTHAIDARRVGGER